MDPVTAIGVATTAYQAIVKGFKVGKEVESMAGDIGRWMNAINDVKQGHEKAKKRRFGSIEEEALETYAAKRKAEKMEDELRNFLIAHYGLNAWNDVIKIQAQIRRQRQLEMEARKRRMEKAIEIFWVTLGLMIIGLALTLLVWWVIELRNLRRLG